MEIPGPGFGNTVSLNGYPGLLSLLAKLSPFILTRFFSHLLTRKFVSRTRD